MDKALDSQLKQNNTAPHMEWIAILLTRYYDPMYEYLLSSKTDRIVFRGDKQAVGEWLDHYRK